uniref:Uncharacterized protein n=1 Tax=Ditylenchus dipsaci TaxID=166011 RepID=A0A915DTR8_9BILA
MDARYPANNWQAFPEGRRAGCIACDLDEIKVSRWCDEGSVREARDIYRLYESTERRKPPPTTGATNAAGSEQS